MMPEGNAADGALVGELLAIAALQAGRGAVSQPSETIAPPRAVRVFVSSTFQDMQAERDELIKRVFPQLRKLCAARGVAWDEVDLRWGITDEQRAEGKVLPICLARVDNCRPFFVGLLGERYGWVSDAIDEELIEQQPWLSQYRDRSVTELEILHGALNDPGSAAHAFFYLRSPAFIQRLPAAQRDAFCEVPTAETVARVGRQEAERDAAERQRKLVSLKERIRASGLPVREDYPDPQALGTLVLADLTAVLEQRFPAGSTPDPLAREAAMHQALGESRSRVYIKRSAYFTRLDAHAAGTGRPLVVLGESGGGKSALLANWVLGRHGREEVLVAHFVGASAASTDWAAMLRRIIGELDQRLNLRMEIPTEPQALRVAFASTLDRAATKARIVLVLDGLNQLDDRDGAPDLVWLPLEVPANLRLVVSTAPGRLSEELQQRGWPSLKVEPLTIDERRRLIVEYLAQSGRAISPVLLRRMADADQSANPLFLRVLLDELCVLGKHETLPELTEHYLAASTVDALYQRLLARWELDYERERPGLVRVAMSLLWAARRGLTESELLDLLGEPGTPLPQALWSPLYLAAEPSFVIRAGVIGFSHQYLRQAVHDRYLHDEAEHRIAHLRLGDYFMARDLTVREADELPWQLLQAQAWPRLRDVFADLSFLTVAWAQGRFDVLAGWRQLELNSSFTVRSTYQPALDNLDIHLADVPAGPPLDRLWTLACLLQDTEHINEAFLLLRRLAVRFRRIGDQVRLVDGLGRLGSIRASINPAEALVLYQHQERLARDLGDAHQVAEALFGQANIRMMRGEVPQALQLQRECENTCRQHADWDGLQRALGAQGVILAELGKLDEALALSKEEERVCRILGDRYALGVCIVNRGRALCQRRDVVEGLDTVAAGESLLDQLGFRSKHETVDGLLWRAQVLRESAQFQDALRVCEEAEQLARQTEHPGSLANCLIERADVLIAAGRQAEAASQAQKAHEVAVSHGLHGLARVALAILHRVDPGAG
jgi:tetratricopeptide (TPR) repeat protein